MLDATQPFNCEQTTAVGGTIEEVSLHGRSLPGSYLLPAAFARFGNGMWSTLMLARFGMLLQNTFLFAIAVGALSVVQRRGWPFSSAAMMSTALLVTPVLVFLAGTMSPSATEILSAGAFTAVLVVAGRAQSARLLWAASALSVFASWSRDLGGPAVVIAAASVGFLEPDVRQWFRQTAGKKWLPAGLGVIGVLTSQAWQIVMKHPLGPVYGSVSQVWRDIYLTVTTLRDAVGLGGWLNTRMDPLLEITWVLMWLLVLAVLLRGASSRVRIVLLGHGIVLFTISVLLIGSQRAGGFGTQGRYLLPFVAVSVIVLATAPQPASIRIRAMPRRELLLFASFIAVGHCSAFLMAAHRHARGLSRPINFSAAVWAPFGGWVTAGVFVAVGTVCLLISTLNFGTSVPNGRTSLD